jgi:hypothetical protein
MAKEPKATSFFIDLLVLCQNTGRGDYILCLTEMLRGEICNSGESGATGDQTHAERGTWNPALQVKARSISKKQIECTIKGEFDGF